MQMNSGQGNTRSVSFPAYDNARPVNVPAYGNTRSVNVPAYDNTGFLYQYRHHPHYHIIPPTAPFKTAFPPVYHRPMPMSSNPHTDDLHFQEHERLTYDHSAASTREHREVRRPITNNELPTFFEEPFYNPAEHGNPGEWYRVTPWQNFTAHPFQNQLSSLPLGSVAKDKTDCNGFRDVFGEHGHGTFGHGICGDSFWHNGFKHELNGIFGHSNTSGTGIKHMPLNADHNWGLPPRVFFNPETNLNHDQVARDDGEAMESLNHVEPFPPSAKQLTDQPSTPLSQSSGKSLTYFSSSRFSGPSVDSRRVSKDESADTAPTFRHSSQYSGQTCSCSSCVNIVTQNAPMSFTSNDLSTGLSDHASLEQERELRAENLPNEPHHTPDYDPPSTLTHPAQPSTADPLDEVNRLSMETTPEMSDGSDAATEPDINDQAVKDAAHRRDRDRYLLKMRQKGYSYREIKRRGQFQEAESTLRGRVRVLTKDKSERVRKPEWTANDVNLLYRAVHRYVQTVDMSNPGRFPWKQISQHMRQQGSSYLFAAGTCAKKWKQLN